jgi:hypothetical protein
MRDLNVERILESLQRRFGVSLKHPEIHAVLQAFIRWLGQKTDHKAVGTYVATLMPVGCGPQADDGYDDDNEPDRGHTQST